MKKPKVFLSSTIYDFKDLRSAIKYYLEENGFDVQASETVDFDVDTSCHSYEACIRNIESCQYFILLIGSRKGGLYDREKNISITQAEYRKAYELARDGKLKLLCFVRKEIYDIRIDRKSIYKGAESEEISTIPSPIIQDPEFVFTFIDEVSRNSETLNGEKPISNWLFQFQDFKDIISTLKHMLSLSLDIDSQIWIENIKRELAYNFRFLFSGDSNNLSPTHFLWNISKEKFSTRKATITLTGDEVWHMGLYELLSLHSLKNIDIHIMKEVLTTGVFFDYAPDKKALLPNKVFIAIEKLISKIIKFQLFYNVYESSYMKQFYNQTHNITPKHGDNETLYEFNFDMIFILASLAFLHIDIANLHMELLKTLIMPHYKSQYKEEVEYSIIPEENAQMKKEQLSYADALKFIENIECKWTAGKICKS